MQGILRTESDDSSQLGPEIKTDNILKWLLIGN